MSSEPVSSEIGRLRARIDELDAQAIGVLAERFRLVGRLALLKRDAGVPVEDERREDELRAAHERLAHREGLDPEIAEAIFEAVLAASKRLQARRIDGGNRKSGT